MSLVSNSVISNLYSQYTAGTSKTSAGKKAESTSQTSSTSKYGNTIGNVKLSDTASKYYEELKSKYSNMDFVVVSKDETENAEQKAQQYANSDKLLVIIDEDTLERMATDENEKTKYENIIGNAESNINDFKSQLDSSGMSGNVKTYGIKVNADGTTSYFAVLKNSSQAQKERIEKKAEEKRSEKKEAQKKENARKLEDIQNESKAARAEKAAEYTTLTADSIEELMNKIKDFTYEARANEVQTDEEKMVGQTIDFRG